MLLKKYDSILKSCLPEEAVKIMKKLLVMVWLVWILVSCTAGKDYRRPLESWLNYDIITTSKDYQKILDSWLGYNIATLVRLWGYPTNVFEVRNGNTAYVFNRLDERQTTLAERAAPQITNQFCAGNTSLCLNQKRIFSALPVNIHSASFKSKAGITSFPEYISLTYDNEAGDQTSNSLCETIFEVSAGNSITHWSYRGNDCY